MDNEHIVLNAEELDAIGEIMNMSMGAAATAVSTMLEKQVTITTPKLSQDNIANLDCSELEPSIVITIKYVEGINGINTIMLRRKDMKIILDLLMGNDYTSAMDDLEFDEMCMSASCEVMNQMMGASSTALAEILGTTVNISAPQAMLADNGESSEIAFKNIVGIENLVIISFKMSIKDVLDTTFSCFLSAELASWIVHHVSDSFPIGLLSSESQPAPAPEAAPAAAPTPAPAPQPVEQPQPEPVKVPEAAPVSQAPAPAPQPVAQPVATPQPVAPPAPAPQPVATAPTPAPVPTAQPIPTPQPVAQPAPAPVYAQPVQPMQPMVSQVMPEVSMAQPQYQQPMQPLPVYAQPVPQPAASYAAPPVNVRNAEFPNFASQNTLKMRPDSNLDLLMGVQLEVSVVIGKTKRKIKEIADFGQGSVLELNKQTGAPADVVVNGQLIAHGDVIVVGDSFGVRITEIVGTKELMESIDPNA